MTKTYNVTIEGIVNQLIDNLPKIKSGLAGSEGYIYIYKTPSVIKGQYCHLNKEEIRKIAQIINDIFFDEYPLIRLFYEYMKELAQVMSRAKLGIIALTCFLVSSLPFLVFSNTFFLFSGIRILFLLKAS